MTTDDFGDSYWQLPTAPLADLRQLSPGAVDEIAFRDLADNLPSLCWIANADGYIVWYNRRWHQYCGTTPEEMEGTGWQSVHDPAILPSVVAAWGGAIERGDPFEMTFPLRGADGQYRPFLTRIIPLRDADGVPQRWIGNNVDVGAQQRVEEELRTARDDYLTLSRTLEEQVSERTAQHMAIEEKLRQSQKLEAVGQLTGGVAHDFNNLLTVIRGSVDLLRRTDLSEEKRARYIDAIGQTADRAAKVTGQLLAFARRQALTPTLFDVGVSLAELVSIVATLAGSRITVDLRAPDEDYYIVADRSQFDTALINMCVNARDAMQGEGRLTIATGPISRIPAIRGHAPVAGAFIAVTIRDTGSGIAPEAIDAIFEPFYTTKGVGEGTGLGLSQVIGFAKQSGGDISAQTFAGEGTVFTLYLPRAFPNEDDRPDAASVIMPVDGDGHCVLVVEDNAHVGAFATAALAELGYHSVLAVDGQGALAELADNATRFDVVFSDVVMPGMSGLELGAQIRARYPDLPIVLTSGYSHVLAQDGQHGFELLHKPYSVEQLSRVLRQAVAGHARRSAP
jgi:PAS domain S-box-containing protein